MNWGVLITILLFVISIAGAIGLTLSFFGKVNDEAHFVGSTFFFLFGLGGGLIALLALSQNKDKVKYIEFPASQFRLELKITEFQGETDTTFVLIPKENK